MDEVFANLETEYCPPLDPALLSAIVSDFDLSAAEGVRQARLTLEPLKEDALLEEQTDLKEDALLEEQTDLIASGTGARDTISFRESRVEDSCPDSSISDGLSSLALDCNADDARATLDTSDVLEGLDEETKVQLLLEVFHYRTSRYNAQYTLRKCGGKWYAAMEELLNHVYLEEAHDSDGAGPIRAKGIQGFSVENVPYRNRNRGKRGNKRIILQGSEACLSTLPVSPVESSGPSLNKWQSFSEDIEFIAKRTNQPSKAVASIYHRTGASMPRTIATILEHSVREDQPSDDPVQAAHAHELGVDFPSILPEWAAAMIRLTHPSTAAAHELATILVSSSHVCKPKIGPVAHYSRPQIGELGTDWQSSRKKSSSVKAAGPSAIGDADAAERASACAAARRTALSQAHAAHRKARSNRLLGGAAAYYGQLYREYGRLSSEASARAADQLAEAQSTPHQVDLHGIDVANATRIAQEKVARWWEDMGEDRVNGRIGARQRQTGYKIVVGLGRHSEGGKGKLGPAVSKRLTEGGWKIEAAGAIIWVKGRVQK